MSTVTVQVALDVTTADAAIELGRTAQLAGADWIELGKPLIEFEGISGVAPVCAALSDSYLLMDLMIMAAPEKYVAAAAALGVSNVTVTALAPRETVAAAVESGRRHGVHITVDLFNVADPVAMAVMAQDLGADYVMVHFGVDQKKARPDGAPIEDLRAVVAAVSIPVTYATYDLAEALAARAAGAAVIVQGEPLTSREDAELALREFIDHVTTGTTTEEQR